MFDCSILLCLFMSASSDKKMAKIRAATNNLFSLMVNLFCGFLFKMSGNSEKLALQVPRNLKLNLNV